MACSVANAKRYARAMGQKTDQFPGAALPSTLPHHHHLRSQLCVSPQFDIARLWKLRNRGHKNATYDAERVA